MNCESFVSIDDSSKLAVAAAGSTASSRMINEEQIGAQSSAVKVSYDDYYYWIETACK